MSYLYFLIVEIMKKINLIILITISGLLSFSAGMLWERNHETDLKTQVLKKSQAENISDSWGNISLFTNENTNTYGTENMVSGIAEIKPGEEIHPPHKHSEEEFLLVIEGSGTWNINGVESEANTGDLMYSQPWDLHGIKNTGVETMKFFFVKWNNKEMKRPLEKE